MANSTTDSTSCKPAHEPWSLLALRALCRLVATLPWPLQRRLGLFLGGALQRLAGSRVSTTRINLELCFPDLNHHQRDVMLREIFEEAGLGIIETLNAWHRAPDAYDRKVSVQGLEVLRTAQAKGKGVLLVGGHSSLLDLGVLLVAPLVRVDMIYRPQPLAVVDALMRSGRTRFQGRMIHYRDMRGLVRSLRTGGVVWYPADQDAGRSNTVFAPFFGINASTLTTPARLARTTGCEVVMIHFRRCGRDERYDICFEASAPASGDALEDATTLNRHLEHLIRRAPTQYMWYHRRFKTRPPGEPSPYPVRDISHRQKRRHT